MRTLSVLAGLFVATTALWTGPGSAQEPEQRAGILVSDGEGDLRRLCVTLEPGETMTGYDALVASDLDVEVSVTEFGAGVCRIGNAGCPAGDCFCDPDRFWGYFTRDQGDATWSFSDVGSNQRTLSAGSLDGWAWTSGDVPALPETTVEEVCEHADVHVPEGVQATDTLLTTTPSAAYIGFAVLLGLLVVIATALVIRRRRG